MGRHVHCISRSEEEPIGGASEVLQPVTEALGKFIIRRQACSKPNIAFSVIKV